jgi:uncharacterized protein YgbK (DUF1537 family)
MNILYGQTTQKNIREIESSQQDFINNYLKEKQKQRVRRGEIDATIEVSYEGKNRKRQYKRGHRLNSTTKELEDIRLENQRLKVTAERLKLENQLLKSAKKTKQTSKNRRYKRATTATTKKSKKSKKRYRRKIYIKVDTVLKKMRIYRGSKLLYNWPIIMRESTVNRHKDYKTPQSYRKDSYTQSFLRAQKKRPIYFNNVKDSKEKKKNTLYSTIKLRQKHINILNDLMKKYGKRNVIIKMIR